MKKLLRLLGYIIHHNTDKYVETVRISEDLHYTEWRLYRIKRLFGFKYRSLHSIASNLGDGPTRRSDWRKFAHNINLCPIEEK